jgi:hypothetical protein
MRLAIQIQATSPVFFAEIRVFHPAIIGANGKREVRGISCLGQERLLGLLGTLDKDFKLYPLSAVIPSQRQ